MPTISRKSSQRPWVKERKPFGTVKQDNYTFYNSKAWRDCATAHKVAHNYMCKNADVCGGAAVITNHNPPLRHLLEHRLNPFDWQYLEDLCVSCNASTTGKQAHKKKDNG